MKHITMESKNHETGLSFNEEVQLKIKRKWQIALRRYILESNPSVTYAPYFGLPAADLHKWIEAQFIPGMTWGNFGKAWNLSQKIPSHLFNLLDDKELSLCWHFINITVQNLQENSAQTTVDVFTTRQYFQELYENTGLEKFKEMLDKITQIETMKSGSLNPLLSFIRENQQKIELIRGFDSEDFSRLNKGEELQGIIMEKEIIKKYGS